MTASRAENNVHVFIQTKAKQGSLPELSPILFATTPRAKGVSDTEPVKTICILKLTTDRNTFTT